MTKKALLLTQVSENKVLKNADKNLQDFIQSVSLKSKNFLTSSCYTSSIKRTQHGWFGFMNRMSQKLLPKQILLAN